MKADETTSQDEQTLGSINTTGSRVIALGSLGPLLRGVGSTIMLIAAIVGFCIARHNLRVEGFRQQAVHQSTASSKSSTLPGAASISETVEGSAAEPQHSLAEEVIENPWFELFGLAGAAVVSSSFYVEWAAKRRENA